MRTPRTLGTMPSSSARPQGRPDAGRVASHLAVMGAVAVVMGVLTACLAIPFAGLLGVAAKDVSMAGIVGSLAMLLECHRLGATVDLDAVPVPAGVALGDWLVAFPCFAFLLCVPAGREDDCARPFTERGIQAAVIGTVDASGEVAVSAGGRREVVIDLASEAVTGL